MSPITVIRNRIVQEFETLRRTEAGRVPQFDVKLVWLSEIETNRTSTYCVVVSGETRDTQTHAHDIWTIHGKIVVWAHDPQDASEKVYEMIEDAQEVLRRAFQDLRGTIQSARADEWNGPERTTTSQKWAQAVIPWSCTHQRAGMV